MKAEWIARQSSHPRGWVGRIVSRVMAWDTARVNDLALERLAPANGEAILEIGCGHGRSLQRLARRTSSGLLAGIDPSEVMRGEARRRNAASIADGRVRVERGDAASIPFADASFDAVFTVHTLYFWPDLRAGLDEIRRVTRDGGRLLLVHRPLGDPGTASNLPESVYTLQSVDAVEKQLSESGFEAVETELEGDAKSKVALTSARAKSVAGAL